MKAKTTKSKTPAAPVVVSAPPMVEVKKWKEFYAFLGAEFQTPFNKKCYRRLFSLAKRGYGTICTVYSNEIEYKFVQKVKDNFELIVKGTHLTANARFTKIPRTLTSGYLKCLSTGYEVQSPYWNRDGIQAARDSQGNHVLGPFYNLERLSRCGLSDIAWAGTKTDLERQYANNEEYVRKVDFFDAGSYSVSLVVKDHLWYKKGQLIDIYYDYKNYNYQDRSPLDLFKGGHYWSVYNSRDSIACDLNKVTLAQLEKIDVSPDYCGKMNRTIGCSRGCSHSCLVEGTASRDAQRKAFYIKTYKDLGLGA